MKRNDAEQIGKLIQQFLRRESLESPLNEQRLLDAWPKILGGGYRYYKYYFSLMVIIISMRMSKDSAGTSSTNWNGKQIPAL